MLRKMLFVTLVLIIVAVMFVSAGGQKDSAMGTSSSGPVKLTMMYWHPEQKDIMEKMNARFAEENPGVSIELEQVPGDQYDQVLKTRLLSDNGPDLFLYFGGTAFLYGKDGHFADLSKESFAENVLPAFRGTCSYEGKLYAVPLSALCSGVWYNKDVFAKAGVPAAAPNTYQDFVDLCARLQKAGVTPIARGAKDAWTGLIENSSMLASLVLGKNENFQVERAQQNFKFAEDAGFIDFMNKYIELVDRDFIVKGSLGLNHSQAVQLVADGKCAMNMFLSLGYGELKQANPDIDLGYFSIPDERGNVSFMGASDKAIGYWSKGKNKELAGKVIAFYARPDVNKMYCEATATLPCITGVDAKFDQPVIDVANELAKAKVIFTWFDAPWPQPAEDEFRRIIQDTHTGERDINKMLTGLDKVYDDNITIIRSATAR